MPGEDVILRRWLWTGFSIAAVVVVACLPALPARAAQMVATPPYRPKDFALVKKDGVFHLFYIRHDANFSLAFTEKDLGHATSYDLYNWTQQPPVLPARDGEWDNQHVWAPSIVLRDGLYTLFYCGVSNVPGVYDNYQRIGIATSTDLFNWTPSAQPVFSCEQVPWSFCDPLQPDLTGFRDAFVMPDPSQSGGWLMYYTANDLIDSGTMVVGVARSSGDLSSWSDVRPLWITHREWTGSGFAESPHVFEHGGQWFLFLTVNGSDPIAYATSPDPAGDLPQWTYRGSLNAMLGVTISNAYASEYFRDGAQEYFCYVIYDRIEIQRISWIDALRFTLVSPDPFHVVDLAWQADSVPEGQPATLQIASVNSTGMFASIEPRVMDSTGQWIAAPPESLGLPASVPLTGDTTRWTWTSRRWPSGSTTTMQVRIRTSDQTAVTGAPLRVTWVPPPRWNALAGGTDEPIKLHIARFARGASGIEMRVELASDQRIRLELYDVQGRRVATLANGPATRGTHRFEWDGRGSQGRPALAGMYLVRLSTPRWSRVARLAWLP